jgi:hypothetical protein
LNGNAGFVTQLGPFFIVDRPNAVDCNDLLRKSYIDTNRKMVPQRPAAKMLFFSSLAPLDSIHHNSLLPVHRFTLAQGSNLRSLFKTGS